MLTKEELQKEIEFDEAVFKAGGFLDTTFKTPSYKIRDMHRWAKECGKDVEKLTDEEREMFLIKKPKIWIIRHAESMANAGGVTVDHKTIPLSPLGLEQAQTVSQTLTKTQTPTLIISSPFLRAAQTAIPTIRLSPSAACETWEDIREFTYLAPDSCIGTTAKERRERRNEYWERLDPDFIDGEGAESFNDLLARTRAVIARLRRYESGFIVMFTHAQFMWSLWLLKQEKIGMEEESKKLMKHFRELPKFWNCEIVEWRW